MNRIVAEKMGSRRGLLSALALAAALGLAGCESIDDMLFGTSDEEPKYPTPASSEQPAGGTPGAPAMQATMQAPMAMPMAARGSVITPVAIAPGSDTGTGVSKTIQQLRGQIENLENHLGANAQRLADIRNANASSAGAYQEDKAHIMAHLQLGTTRGNPELISQWNGAQAALDQMSSNINTLNALGTDVTSDSSAAHFALDSIVATFNISGAVDEDHRQLAVLEDETNQTIVLVDRLLKDVSDDIQRQTAYVANERANLTTLANGIKNGELYSSDLSSMSMMSAAAPMAMGPGGVVAVVHFDRKNPNYQQSLYASLNQALASRPGANFEIVAVSPTRGSAAAVQIAQTTAKRHAQEVLRAMTDMGVPASRLAISSSTDPAISAGEVRVFLR
ncbi:MAG TPA: hypothetical protein VIJ62_15080 [Rhizomicrobium sp.]